MITGAGGRGHYRLALAHTAAWRALALPRDCRLVVDTDTRERVTAELKLGRSPYTIWADLDADDVAGRPCVETIYTAI